MSLKFRFSLFVLGIGILPLLVLAWFRLEALPGTLEGAGVSADVTDGLLADLTDGLLALIFLLALLAVFVTIFVVRLFVEPIILLTEAMREFRNHRESPHLLPVLASGEIGEMTETFNDMATQLAEHIAELKQSDETKSQFIAILAHELRNPMAPIMLSLEFLEMMEIKNPEIEEMLNVIKRQIMAMHSLLDQLLDVSRLERGRDIELHRKTLRLTDVLAEAAESSQPFLREGQATLHVTPTGEDLLLDADPVRLNQILVNLLKNATQYTEAGGGIWLSARREGSDVLISVRDEGKGIPKEAQPHLFELFSRGEGKATRQSPGGLGIGLYLVKMFTELHGGGVRVVSEGKEGSGAEFIVRLPVAET